MMKVRIALLAILGLFSWTGLAAPKVYEVSASIKESGKVVATPAVRVKPGAPAEMSVSGENAFRLSVVVVPTETDAIDVSVDVGTSTASLKTVVATLAGKPIAVSSGDLEVVVTVTEGDG